MNLKHLCAILLLLCLTSCLNKSETTIVGSYIVASYKIRKGFKDVNTKPYLLVLSDDKTFVFNTGKKKVTGDWKGNYFRGEIHIEFYFDDYNFDTQGSASIDDDQLHILNAHHFLDETIDAIAFKKSLKSP